MGSCWLCVTIIRLTDKSAWDCIKAFCSGAVLTTIPRHWRAIFMILKASHAAAAENHADHERTTSVSLEDKDQER